MFGSRSYRLSKRSELESSDSLGSLGKITFRSDITDGSSPSNPFSRQNRPSTLPARFKRPTPRSPSAPSIPTFQNSPLSDVSIVTVTKTVLDYLSAVSISLFLPRAAFEMFCLKHYIGWEKSRLIRAPAVIPSLQRVG